MSRGMSRGCEVFIPEGELRISVIQQKSHMAFGAVCSIACPALCLDFLSVYLPDRHPLANLPHRENTQV